MSGKVSLKRNYCESISKWSFCASSCESSIARDEVVDIPGNEVLEELIRDLSTDIVVNINDSSKKCRSFEKILDEMENTKQLLANILEKILENGSNKEETQQDLAILGHQIPVGTTSYPHFHGINMDEIYFPNPKELFTPEGFLNKDGNSANQKINQPSLQPEDIVSKQEHKLVYNKLEPPTKCRVCQSVIIGLDRQGAVCSSCGFTCHLRCAQLVHGYCPGLPVERPTVELKDTPDLMGFACEDIIAIADNYQGTNLEKVYLVLDKCKLYLFGCATNRQGKILKISRIVRQVYDLKDMDFSVPKIHYEKVVKPKGNMAIVFCILKNPVDVRSGTAQPVEKIFMAKNVERVKKWVSALAKLKGQLNRSNLPPRQRLMAKQALDPKMFPQIKNVLCAAIIDRTKIVIGTRNHSLLCLDIEKEIMFCIGEFNQLSVEKVLYNESEQLLLVMIGHLGARHLRIIPSAALFGKEVEWINMQRTLGCHLMAMGQGDANMHYMAAAVEKSVIIYQIDRSQNRHKEWKELSLDENPQSLSIENGRLIVGYSNGFSTWLLTTEPKDFEQIYMVDKKDKLLQFLNKAAYNAQMMVEVNTGAQSKEYLLVFNKLGVYVNEHGRKSRSEELMFPANPRSGGFSYRAPYLLVYSEYEVDVFNVNNVEWIQTLSLRSAYPLTPDGCLSFCFISNEPCIILLHGHNEIDELIHLPKENIQFSTTDLRIGSQISKTQISEPYDPMHLISYTRPMIKLSQK